MKKTNVLSAFLGCLMSLSASVPAWSAQVLRAMEVSQAPVIDGVGEEGVWGKAVPLIVVDKVSEGEVDIRSVRTEDSIFFLLRFADTAEDRLHKPWVWDKGFEAYVIGPQREDTFIFKWNMMEPEVDLSNFSEDSYTADIWYWKANRTDPAGFADDKRHVLGDEEAKKAQEVTTAGGKKRYLRRIGDQGSSAQTKRILASYQGDLQGQYQSRQPDGSRSDVRAKGSWKDGFWTLEFGRKLQTGHNDDIQFYPASGTLYLFGVSIFGLYGEPIDRSKSTLYGQGRLSEPLHLSFN